ncbi:DNA polymerase III subunit gamma/tau [Microbacterium sp.]|uniref:DNA polymerase III subunit gamma/tau n=1 Tax=Microbacterium sp. TaxID=51671 RepID=UPI0025F453E5|nr:DNA polymerase III subunit gamma/tau [Microbacterium sp.]
MSSGRDEDSLTWDGDDDPTLDAGAAAPALPDGFTAVGRGSGEVGHIAEDGTISPAGAPAPLGNALLVAFGVIGGVYALYVVGWIVGGLRLQGTANFLVSPVGYGASLWLAAAAPVLWFATAYIVTRASKSWVRIAWLVAGLALLVPWPFILVGALGTVA